MKIAAIASLLVLAAGLAAPTFSEAKQYTIDLTGAADYGIWRGDIDLHLGDSVLFNVTFDPPADIPFFDYQNAGLLVNGRGPTNELDHGFVDLVFPWLWGSPAGPGTGISTEVQLISYYLPPTDPFTYHLTSFEWYAGSSPEPQTWLLLMTGLLGLGGMLRKRRTRALRRSSSGYGVA